MNQNNIQTIIDNAKTKYPLNTFSGETLKELEVVLKDSLTSMLDESIKEIEKVKLSVHQSSGSYKYDDCYDDCINIINSHR